jgi:HlyD family secretion protein
VNYFTSLGFVLALAGAACADDPPAAKAASRVVTALGRVEPTEVVEIAARVAGGIEKVTADYGDKVLKGQVLAQLDAAPYRAEADRAKAAVAKAQARLELARAKMLLARRHFDRLAKLRESKAVDETEFETGKAEVMVAEAGARLEEAGIAESRAALERVELDLSYCTIHSPIDGVVLDRRCTAGQVVAAGAGPGLFRIASNLKTVHVLASVAEADIARIAAGQAAQITVDALPETKFEGKVTQVRLNGARRGAGTYTVVVAVDNSAGKLLPYLTAKVSIAVVERR